MQGRRRCVDVLLHVHKRPSGEQSKLLGMLKTLAVLKWAVESLTFWPQVTVFGAAGPPLSRFWNSFRNWRQECTTLSLIPHRRQWWMAPHLSGGTGEIIVFCCGLLAAGCGWTDGIWLMHVNNVTSAERWLGDRKWGLIKRQGESRSYHSYKRVDIGVPELSCENTIKLRNYLITRTARTRVCTDA